jgi:putative peptide zinc metalloprotease protein
MTEGRQGHRPSSSSQDGASAAPDGAPPKLAEGIELIGVYEGSGFKEPPYIARRADGQVIQLPQLLYMLAEEIDGRSSYDEIGDRLSQRFRRGLSPDNVRFLVDEKLRPLGVVTQADGSSPQLQKLDPLLALKFRAAVVPERVVNAITTVLRPLFLPPVVVAVLGGLVALDVWLFFFHGVAQSLRQTLYDPAFILLLLGLVVISAAFHECGHATACRYGGARPGAMGAGIYLVWPAFYTDVTDAYRLGKAGRLRTDLGGIYFNVVFILLTAAAYAVTGFEPLLLVIPLQHLEILHQLLPFLRLDGYYIVSDLTGVPDMFNRIKPALQSLLPWRKPDDRVTALKPWVRVAVSVYVLTLFPALAFLFGMMLINAPRIFATAYDSFFVQLHKVEHAGALAAAVGVVQMIVLVLPSLGIVATFAMIARRFGKSAWTRTEGHPAARFAFAAVVTGAIALVAFVWWPNGDYRPIQPGERGTLVGAVKQFSAIPTGRPGLTKSRERQLGGAPLRSSRGSNDSGPAPAGTPTSTVSSTTPTTSSGASTTTATATTTTTTTPATTTTTAASTTTTATVTTTATTAETATTP